MWPTVGRYRLSVASPSMFGRYFAHRSPTYHRRMTHISPTLGQRGIFVHRRSGRHLGRLSAATGYRSLLRRRFTDGSPTYHRHLVDVDTWPTVHRYIADTRINYTLPMLSRPTVGRSVDGWQMLGRYVGRIATDARPILDRHPADVSTDILVHEPEGVNGTTWGDKEWHTFLESSLPLVKEYMW